jgi:thioredoxin reductase (NADPH)
MEQPIIVLVADEAAVLEALEPDVARRFGNDCEILAFRDPEQALARLEALAAERAPVALLIVDEDLGSLSGIEFCVRAHELHPVAKRILLVERNYTAANPVVTAMTLGQIDYHLVKPWYPHSSLYPAISEFLSGWSRGRSTGFTLFRIVAPEQSRRAHEIRDIFARLGMPFVSVATGSEDGAVVLREAGVAGEDRPVVIRHDGKVLLDPSNGELVEAIGGSTRLGSELVDLAIVGAGPAGLSAAVYASSEGLETVVLEQFTSGGQAAMSSRMRNILGFTWGIGGSDFAYRACEQAWLFGANMVFNTGAGGLRAENGVRIVRTADGREVAARAVILSTGVEWRRLDVPALEALIGVGVFYGAAAAEARAVRGRPVCIVGGGNSAGQAAAYLARFAESVTVLVRGDSLAVSMSEYLTTELDRIPNVHVRYATELVDGEGDGRLDAIVVRDRRSGETERIETAALFVMIGAEPHTEWLEGTVARDDRGYVLTGPDLLRDDAPQTWPLERPPALFETSVPGVFAAGDVRHGSVKRVTTAVGEGATAVQLVHAYLAGEEERVAGRLAATG